jgi:hypothetical protein
MHKTLIPAVFRERQHSRCRESIAASARDGRGKNIDRADLCTACDNQVSPPAASCPFSVQLRGKLMHKVHSLTDN